MRRLRPLALLALFGVGCAKFPETSDASQFVRVIVRIEFAAEINRNYVYDVGIHATPELDPQPQLAPQLVLSNSANGRMAGSPTHFVEVDFNNVQPFQLFRFAKQTEVPNPSEPNNPINLQQFAPSTRGLIINFDPPTAGTRVLRFELFTNLLADNDVAARQLNTLLFNFLPMSRLETGSGGGLRFLDAFGDTRTLSVNQYLLVDLRANRVYRNLSLVEPEGDTLPGDRTADPALDIVDFTVEVQRP